ncbi:PAS domain S-box protein [Candidatus Margulisiibacteriota bacterium]
MRYREIVPQNIIETSIDGVVIIGLDLKVLQTNSVIEKKLGYEKDSVIGKPSFTALDKNRNEIPVIVNVSLLKNSTGHADAYYVVLRDVSIYKQTEELKKATRS